MNQARSHGGIWELPELRELPPQYRDIPMRVSQSAPLGSAGTSLGSRILATGLA